ncbi:MAG: glycosyltransferase family 39 protein [Thermoanaerobaculia bacterium]|nr:MAG: glycosyltransferase family 39 protein [Thermoanaerobaculia bacterium]
MPGASRLERRRELAGRFALPLAVAAFHALLAEGYGVFRDELYYFACGRHLDWGYVDHPPMVAVLAALSGALFGTSWVALRMFSALAAGATVLIVGDTARALGGGRWARLIAQLLAALAPGFVAVFATYSMNPVDVLLWAALFGLATRLLAGADPRLWLAFGALAGLALETKISALYLGAGLVAGLLLERRGDVLSRAWFWAGGGLAALVFAPFVLWQAAHGWPTLEFVDNARRLKIQALAPQEYVLSQFLQAGPAGFALALAGAAWLLLARAARPWRALGWGALVTLAILAFGRSKPYYFGPVLTLLFPAAAVALESWTGRSVRVPPRLLRAVALLLVALQAALVPLAKPMLPVDTLVRYAAALGFEAGSDENQEVGRLHQYFADMHGWRELAESVARVHAALPAADRARACVVASNYGEAGAIDFFRPELDLPPAISGHNSYWFWGPGECTGEVLLILGEPREEHAGDFESLELGGVHDCTDCMPYEDDLPIWIARGLKVDVHEAWRGIRHFI